MDISWNYRIESIDILIDLDSKIIFTMPFSRNTSLAWQKVNHVRTMNLSIAIPVWTGFLNKQFLACPHALSCAVHPKNVPV
jgi:hypothetical protein